MKYSNLYITLGAVTVIFCTIPFWAGIFIVDALILYLLYLAAAEVWSFMAKHAGLISLGQQIFVGVGGYMTTVLTMYYGLHILLSGVLSGLIGAAIATVLSFPLLRMRGMYFAIGSLLAAEIVRLFFNGWEFVGAGKGLIFRDAYTVSRISIYYSAAALAAFSIFLIVIIYRSRIGYGLRAIGSDEDAAQSVGVNSFRLKALMFVLSSLVISLVGAIHAVNRTYLTPTAAFGIGWTVDFLFISVIGGIGRLTGPIIGGLILITLRYMFSQFIGISLLLEGIVVLVILLTTPEGVWGLLYRKLKLNLPSFM